MTLNNKHIGIILVVAFVFGLVLAQWLQAEQKQENTAIPDIWQIQFSNNRAKKNSLNDYESEYLVIDFWSSWCKPCVKSLPFYQALFSQFPTEKIQFVAISLDVDKADAETFLAEYELEALEVLFDPKAKTEQAFAIRGMPTLLIFDKNRKLIKQKLGFKEKDKQAFEQLIKQLVSS